MKYILQFLQEWLEWAKNDAPKHNTFIPQCGLCDNLDEWLVWETYLDEDGRDDVSYEFRAILKKDSSFADWLYPFGKDDYCKELLSRSHHKNLNRLCWVEGKIEELSKEKENV